MLKIKFREKEHEAPLQANCPWLNYVTPDIILNKDGGLLAGFSFEGLDPDNIFEEKIDSSTKIMERAYNGLDERITAWWIVDKREDTTYAEMGSENPASREVDRLYSKRFKAGKNYVIRYHFYMLFTGVTGTDKMLDRVQRLREEGGSLSGALLGAMKESLSGGSSFARDFNVLRDGIASFNRIITTFTQSTPLKFERLRADAFTSALSAILNRASPISQREKPSEAFLDSWLPLNYLEGDDQVLKFTGNGKPVYAGALALVKFPDRTTPMQFESLAELDMELTICQIIRFLGQSKSKDAVDAAIEYYRLTQYGLVTHAIAKASGNEPEANPGKEDLLAKCIEALTILEINKNNFVYHNTTVFVYGKSVSALNVNMERAYRLLNSTFTTARERKNTGPSFFGMLPGQSSQQVRFSPLSVENIADMSPIYTMGEGSRKHEFFSKEIYKKDVPALAVFTNRYSGNTYFSPHVGQVGHVCLVAPTGGGKTTFVNFCLSQFQRYGRVKTFIFDRNRSCEIVTDLHDGKHINLISNNARFNPLFALMDGSVDGALWVRTFITNRLAEGNYETTAEDHLAIDTAITRMLDTYQENGEPLRMSTLAMNLPSHLEMQLGEWLEGRPYGMFDSATDDFEFSDWTTIEMREIMQYDRIARAFMDYAMRKIYLALDGTPTFIYLEEATFLMNNKVFLAMLDDWLKTFRKKNAFVWMTIQSPESIANSEIAAILLDNIPTFVMCANPKVESHRAVYKKFFALEDHQIDELKKIIPKREYLLVQNGNSRVLKTEFNSECLAYLRSEEHVLKIFDRHKASGRPDWKQTYLAEVATS